MDGILRVDGVVREGCVLRGAVSGCCGSEFQIIYFTGIVDGNVECGGIKWWEAGMVYGR